MPVGVSGDGGKKHPNSESDKKRIEFEKMVLFDPVPKVTQRWIKIPLFEKNMCKHIMQGVEF